MKKLGYLLGFVILSGCDLPKHEVAKYSNILEFIGDNGFGFFVLAVVLIVVAGLTLAFISEQISLVLRAKYGPDVKSERK